MNNLISNSIKYRKPKTSVLIRLKAATAGDDELEGKDAKLHRQYHKISIIDNGIGFNQQYAEKIFDIFQRLNNLPSAQGSGIGLAICKRIIQNHQGFIKATGKENEGAQFDVYLPQV